MKIAHKFLNGLSSQLAQADLVIMRRAILMKGVMLRSKREVKRKKESTNSAHLDLNSETNLDHPNNPLKHNI